MSQNKTVWIIAGPTASGKSQLAVDLARAANGTVINADSMQIYREIPILSAQPPSYDQSIAPHDLYGFHPLTEHFSAKRWAERAVKAIKDSFKNFRQPILVGGSGLYLRALIEGFSEMPVVPLTVRKHVTDLYDMLGAKKFHDALAKIDPESAARLNPGDRQRCIRAREIYEISGEKLSDWQAAPKQNLAPELSYRSVVLLPPRDWLYDRINRRFSQMVKEGAVEEAQAIQTMNLAHDLTGTHTLGLQALRDFVDGRITLQEAIEIGQSQSRQYAKRQYTWFRNQSLPERLILDRAESEWLALSQKHLLNQ